ncbi:nuclear pore glycoprotein p62 isoform X2 [Saimiri boliviensis]|nr:nuclear pore glycoprotein p62 [Saimiri boliviensis boliviensis]XP_010349407.1 nuclear pore glycoprotein p62 [Saimiri boliviensis boliviensis]XP_010349408.1 nuclear pore glycoprotein p62 [Saimiri boliviensis boliviensis]XP_010349409.1 nuclear pore glycoprotein p62 [Saimiri boliviensis boliviensis]XP_039321561.1 nuclear pore glycoprotein p62 [Saimiri boliviensis boliviensis]XP_039321562.1 nuclear pore glycoprotein p62 [Saimiri boliviensis boliviensis]
MSGFNFGGTGAPTGGFTFGTAKTTTTTPATGFSFSTSGTGGFNFGAPSQPAASTPSTSLFSLATQTPATQTPGFSFGTATPASGGTGFSLGTGASKLNLSNAAATPAMANPSSFGLGSSSLTNAMPSAATSSQGTAPTGFVFGPSTTSVAPATTSGGFLFTGGSTTQTSGFSIGSAGNSAQPTAPAGLSFTPATPAATTAGATQPAAPTPTATTTSAGPTLFASIATAPTSSATTSLSLCTPATTAGAPAAGTLSFSLKAPGAASGPSTTTSTTATTTTSSTSSSTSSTGFALNLKPLAPAGIPSNTAAAVTAPPGPGTAAGVATSSAMTYAQLESLINKWSLELEDQERHFLQQATQVNAWDRTLIENGEKITSLHREVEKVKLDQKRLDQELDFILSQQKELEDLLSPLEELVKEQSGTIYLQHADEEREKTYKLAENIDAQLKRMAQDLKDIIEHLNTSGAPADTSDPLQQICKILNAHMDSLQWIDQNSALLQRKVEEVTKVCEGRRKEQERSFRITFD